MKALLRDKVLFFILIATVVISVVMVLPSSVLAPIELKGFATLIFSLLALIAWSVTLFKGGSVRMPKSSVLVVLALILVAALGSTLFSHDIGSSFVGVGYEPRTLISLLVFSALMLLSIRVFNSIDRYFIFLTAFGAAWLVAFFVFSGTLIIGALTDGQAYSVMGTYNNLALLAGLVAVVFAGSLDTITLKKGIRLYFLLLFVTAVIALVLLNFIISWYVIAFVSLLVSVYVFSFVPARSKAVEAIKGTSRKIPTFSLLVLGVSLVAVFVHLPLARAVTEPLGLFIGEVRPSWEATAIVSVESVKENPILGVGLNRFEDAWNMYKPREVNDTFAWNAQFASGFGFIPSFFITMGFLGGVLWTLFIGLLLVYGIQLVLRARRQKDAPGQYFVVSSFTALVFLWTALVLYVPNATLVMLAFVFSGIFLGSLVRMNMLSSVDLAVSDDPQKSFATIVFASVSLILFVVMLYAVGNRGIAHFYYNQSLKTYVSEGATAEAYRYVSKAIDHAETDVYHRLASEIIVNRLRVAAATGDLENLKQEDFATLAAEAVQHALDATARDEADYNNWVVRGNAYTLLSMMGVSGAVEHADNAYDEAITISPVQPAVYLQKAQLHLFTGDTETARVDLQNSLTQKPDYQDALYLLAQLEVREGNTQAAIDVARQATLITPNNFGAYFQLGYLQYQAGQFQNAAASLEQAIAINPFYANAMYFLGLSYYELDRLDDAISQFEKVLELNPENQYVVQILGNLRSGQDPLEGIEQALDALPVSP